MITFHLVDSEEREGGAEIRKEGGWGCKREGDIAEERKTENEGEIWEWGGGIYWGKKNMFI